MSYKVLKTPINDDRWSELHGFLLSEYRNFSKVETFDDGRMKTRLDMDDLPHPRLWHTAKDVVDYMKRMILHTVGEHLTPEAESFTCLDSSSEYGTHTDEPHRKIACLWYLNDDYEGGELYFTDTGVCIKPQKNSIIMMESQAPHGVLPVTKGKRYSFGVWFYDNNQML